MMRIWEIFESIKILRQAVDKIPEGPVIAKVARTFKPPAGDVHVRVEAARGDMSWYCVSDGSEYPYRVHVRTGSFAAMSIIEELSKGLMIADLVAVIATFDIVAPEVDR
jgi:NADH-quinone oxidoreductase subunit D